MGKIYAVKRGIKPGIYSTWTECQAMTKGFKGAIFKSFPSLAEAQNWLDATEQPHEYDPRYIIDVYVDGSYDDNLKVAGAGVYIHAYNKGDVKITRKCDDSKFIESRNIYGELEAALLAIEHIMFEEYDPNIKTVVINHDYEGIGTHVDGTWATKTPISKYYMEKIPLYLKALEGKGLRVIFKKVKGHSGIEGNEIADRLAAMAITD